MKNIENTPHSETQENIGEILPKEQGHKNHWAFAVMLVVLMVGVFVWGLSFTQKEPIPTNDSEEPLVEILEETKQELSKIVDPGGYLYQNYTYGFEFYIPYGYRPLDWPRGEIAVLGIKEHGDEDITIRLEDDGLSFEESVQKLLDYNKDDSKEDGTIYDFVYVVDVIEEGGISKALYHTEYSVDFIDGFAGAILENRAGDILSFSGHQNEEETRASYESLVALDISSDTVTYRNEDYGIAFDYPTSAFESVLSTSLLERAASYEVFSNVLFRGISDEFSLHLEVYDRELIPFGPGTQVDEEDAEKLEIGPYTGYSYVIGFIPGYRLHYDIFVDGKTFTFWIDIETIDVPESKVQELDTLARSIFGSIRVEE